MLNGLMMDVPLSIPRIMDYAASVHPDTRIISAAVEGGLHEYSYAEAYPRIGQLAHGLVAMGVKPGDRVATLAWNGYRHFELYYAVAGIGAVCHTINPRLFPDQIVYIANHADDRVLCFDLTFLPLVAALAPRLPAGIKLVLLTDRAHVPSEHGLEGLLIYEDLLAGQPTHYDWPDLPETTASSLCYTSGTTGEPKGALYSHRSNVLHSMGAILATPDCYGTNSRILPVVPLFHVNAWGLPYSAPLSGTDLVFPGPKLDGASLFTLMDEQRVTNAWGVPTIWGGLLAAMRAAGRKPAALSIVGIGGAAAPKSMIDAFERDFGIAVNHGWGMTELSPIGAVSREPRSKQTVDQRIEARQSQGKRTYGIEMKIVDDAGRRLPHDGVASGELLVRGGFVISGYYNNEKASAAAFDSDGWFRTGDVARITPQGDLIIMDRTKDLIKSGGEWISSIVIENLALSCPGVAQAAAIALPHPRWDERPLLVIVRAEGSEVTREAVLAHVAEAIARWQVPDDVMFIEALPMTATGKISKLDLRKRFADYQFPSDSA